MPSVFRRATNAHAFGLGLESRMAKKSADVRSRFSRLHVKPDQAVALVTKTWLEEVLVLSEERDLTKAVEERDDVRVLNAVIGDFTPDLAMRNAPVSEQRPLVFGKVFVQQV